MANDIVVNFRVGGVAEIDRAFRNVEQATERLERQTRKSHDNEQREQQRSSRERLREEQRTERETVKLREAGYRENAKIAADEVKATEKAAQAKLREEERWAEQRQRIQQKSAEMAYRIAEKEVNDAQRLRERHARAYGSSIGRSVGGLVRGATNMAGTALMLGGGFGIADAVNQQFAAERAAQRLINATTIAGPDSRANMKDILARAGGIAISSGMTKEQVIQGSIAYAQGAKGGDIGGALGNMDFFAKLSKVSGASIEDIGAAAGVLQSQNKDLAKDPARMRQMLLAAYAQTGAGSVSLTDAAKQIGTLASTRGFFQGDQARNQATLMALGQLAAPGGSASEIGTYVKDFTMEVSAKQKHTSKEIGLGGAGLEQLGVHFDKTGHMESPEQAIEALFKLTKGDIGKLGQLVGKRGMPLLTQLQGEYQQAGGGEAGIAAIHKTIAGVSTASMTEEQLNAKFSATMSSDPERFAKVQQRLTQALEEKLTPMLEKLADSLEKHEPDIESFLDYVAKLAEWAAGNPMEAVVLALAAAIGKGAVTQAVSGALKDAITGAGKRGINLGGALSIAAAGGVAIAAEKAWIDESTKADHENQVSSAMLLPQAATALANLQKNPTEENKKKAQALIAQIKTAEMHVGDKSSFGQIASWFQSADDAKKETAENERKLHNLMDSVSKLDTALKKLGTTAEGAANGSPNSPHRTNPIATRTGVPGTQ